MTKADTFNNWVRTLGLIIGIIAVCAGPSGAGETKFAQVNLSQVLGQSAKVRAALQKIKQAEADYKVKLVSLAQEIKALEQKLADAESLSKQERDTLKDKLTRKKEEYEREQQLSRVRMTFMKKSEQNLVRIELDRILMQIAEKEGYQAIFMNQSIAYARDMPDLTQRVLKALDGNVQETDKQETEAQPAQSGKEASSSPSSNKEGPEQDAGAKTE